ncbi:MAG: MaoC family dehydratase N-terminal domain-containing protein [Deltaproteobacteria bacterium]|nr:MaoC family dehydratase N-terminal domain-containing protein [Deltaproteobacteria bacterium]
MSLDVSTVGATSGTHTHEYGWRDQAAYALGIGAKRDELAFLYEGHPGGMQVVPTYAVVPAFEIVVELLKVAGVDLAAVVHGAQRIVAHRPVPAAGKVTTTGRIAGLYDLKRFAQLVVETHTTLDGEALFDTEWTIVLREDGGFGGERPPRDPAPKLPTDRDADWVVAQATSPEQALLYRLSGDINPLHADPEFAASVGFPEGPILHGLCTYGHIARAVIQQSGAGQATRLRSLTAQFRKPVWPGDTIVTKGWDVGSGKIALRTMVEAESDTVVAKAWAEIVA